MTDVLITPASGKIEFFDNSNNIDAKIELDASGNLNITNPGGDISLGDTTADVYIGDGVNNVDIRFEQNGTITGQGGVTLQIGEANTSVVIGTDLSLSNNDITNVNSLSATSISANGSLGSAADVLTSNGSSVYWAAGSSNAVYMKGGAATIGTLAAGGSNIFRVNANILNNNTTISNNENASATGPLAVANGITLTVEIGARVSIV